MTAALPPVRDRRAASGRVSSTLVRLVGWCALGALCLATLGVATATVGVATATPASALGSPTWAQLTPAGSPPPRDGASMAYDAASGQLVLFGGRSGGVDGLGDTWDWDGTTWTQLTPAASPPAREGASMAYDPATSELLLFGGQGTGDSGYLDDTWGWNGTTWAQLAPPTSPPGRVGASLTYDTTTDQMVLFGGYGTTGYLADTWTFDGTTWTGQSPTVSPPARDFASASDDPGAGQLVLFGGLGGSSGYLGDTWTWDGSDWTEQNPASNPPARDFSSVAYDPTTGRVVLSGGQGASGYLGDTWTWDGSSWTEQSPTESPDPREGASMAYDPSTGEPLLFGGLDGSAYLSDTWTYASGAAAPTAPTDLVAAQGNGEVDLSWGVPFSDGGSTITGYDVFVGTSPGGESDSPVNATPVAASSYGVTGLSVGTTYYFTVEALNGVGAGPASNEASAVSASAPDAPADAAAAAGSTAVPGDGQVLLSWGAATANGSAVSGYAVTPSPSCPSCGGLSAAATSTVVTGLRPGLRYSFSVTATNSVGAGPASAASNAIVPTTVPGPPSGPAVQITPAGAVVVSFGRPAVQGGLPTTGYVVTTEPTCPRCSGTRTLGTSTTVAGLNPGTSYRFLVTALDLDGRGAATAASTSVLDRVESGYWLAEADGHVFGLGAAPSLGGVTTTAGAPVVGLAGTPDARGYLVVTASGAVTAFGDARYAGDLPSDGVHVDDIVAVAPTTDGKGYWLIGRDGGEFAFGDARYHGSLPGLGIHVHDIVGMVATIGGGGYLLVGADGGVFAFGKTHYYGSLPGLGIHVHDIRGILPSATGKGYVLVGADGGAFVFGSGVRYYGSLPGRGVAVDDIVGIALSADGEGYLMAGADGAVYGFGDAKVEPVPAGLAAHLPVAAIGGV